MSSAITSEHELYFRIFKF